MTDAEMLRLEAEQYATVQDAARQFAQRVKTTHLVMAWNDGNGGAYLAAIREALENAGLHDKPNSQKLNARRSANISHHKRKVVFERNEYRCVSCGTHRNLSIDHIIPVARGGSDDVDNLQTMCVPCNTRKGVK